MSFIPFEPLHYAETHFKFKLPWSLLYKPWPEILLDAPFQFVPGVKPCLWVVVRDAHRFPVEIETIELAIQKEDGTSTTRQIELHQKTEEQFDFIAVELDELTPGRYEISSQITAARLPISGEALPQSGVRKTFARWNYPGLKPSPLKIHVLSELPPKAPGFAAGEMHCHTHYSADHVEHGATPEVFQQAALAVGLDFVCCTDHAYDFAYTTEDYTKEADSPLPRFDALRKECAELNQKRNSKERVGLPLIIAGEEVSVGNSKNENVHMTLLGPEGYVPGLGDCGRNWLNNVPTFKISKALQMTQAHCFAAHPLQEMGALEKFVFRRGYWASKDLQSGSSHSVRGIQFWNGYRDEGFKLGKAWWIEELGRENYVLPIGGNDAHGDLNETTAVSLPLFTLKHNRHHIFGNVRTVVKRPNPANTDPLSLDELNRAFTQDSCYITNGPALWWERDDQGKSITFSARSNADFGGGFKYIRIFGRRRMTNGKLTPTEEVNLASQVATRLEEDITVPFENFAYLRAECETATGKFALTSAAVNPRK